MISEQPSKLGLLQLRSPVVYLHSEIRQHTGTRLSLATNPSRADSARWGRSTWAAVGPRPWPFEEHDVNVIIVVAKASVLPAFRGWGRYTTSAQSVAVIVSGGGAVGALWHAVIAVALHLLTLGRRNFHSATADSSITTRRMQEGSSEQRWAARVVACTPDLGTIPVRVWNTAYSTAAPEILEEGPRRTLLRVVVTQATTQGTFIPSYRATGPS